MVPTTPKKIAITAINLTINDTVNFADLSKRLPSAVKTGAQISPDLPLYCVNPPSTSANTA